MPNPVLPYLSLSLGILILGIAVPASVQAEAQSISPKIFEAPKAKGTGTCVATATTLCIDDAPDDRRFEVTVGYSTALNGGSSGKGRALPLSSLGIRRGGLFYFFDPTNPELLIKILNGCTINGNYWIFWSAGTTVGLELTVNDTLTGRTKIYLDPDGSTALPITDTSAFSCP